MKKIDKDKIKAAKVELDGIAVKDSLYHPNLLKVILSILKMIIEALTDE